MYSNEEPILANTLTRATRTLRHRGGDEEGIWISPAGQVGLGHTRLNIVDLNTGRQPIANESESLHLIVNGEFYDFENIRGELEANGHSFRTRSDSEIALHLYEELGPACLERLRGEFAFVIWDSEKQVLFAARDRFGIKPLFYAQIGDSLFLASEAKALFAAGVEAHWDAETVFQTMFLCFDQGSSLFQNIKQIPPGHYLLASEKGTSLQKYWDVQYPPKGRPFNIPDGEVVERVRDLLGESIRLRTIADVPVGVLLSGGLDSSAILGFTQRYVDKPVAAFTVAFDNAAFDESPNALEMANFAGADFRRLFVSDDDMADNFADTIEQGEMVLFNAHGVARFLLSRAIRQAGYKVVLGGEGADELFAGYGFHRWLANPPGAAQTLAKWLGLSLRMIKPQSSVERQIALTSPFLFRAGRFLDAPAALVDKLGDGIHTISSILSADFLNQMHGRDPYLKFFQGLHVTGKMLSWEPTKQITYVWLKSLFANYHMAADRLDMAHEVEVRLPFLDHHLFEFASQIPVSKLVVNEQVKVPLREAAKPLISPSVYERTKKPFLAPPSSHRKGNKFFQLIQDIGRSQSVKNVPFFNQRAVVSLFDELPRLSDQKRAAMDQLLLMIASITILHEHYEL